MCQAKIWVISKGEEREIARDITQLEVEGDEIVLKSFFEPPKVIKGKIKSIDFLKAKVFIEAHEFPE
uniref:CooT family nickel-binding protein n=1 Tax=Caldimicrobium thiodismutans TaxID=1653476 RepID=A0A832GP35_9BACT